MSKFYEGILCNKGDGIGPFNLAIYWKRKYNNKGAKEPWYILTLPILDFRFWIRTDRLCPITDCPSTLSPLLIQNPKSKIQNPKLIGLGLYGQRWRYGMELWADCALSLIALKPHKRLYFQRGFHVLSLMQQAF